MVRIGAAATETAVRQADAGRLSQASGPRRCQAAPPVARGPRRLRQATVATGARPAARRERALATGARVTRRLRDQGFAVT